MRDSWTHRPRQLAPDALEPSEAVDIEPTSLLDALELGCIDAEPLHGVVPAFGRATYDLLGGQIPAVGRWIGITLAHAGGRSLCHGLGVRSGDVGCDERHATVDGGAGQRRADRCQSSQRRCSMASPCRPCRWKSGSATGGAARSAPSSPCSSFASPAGSTPASALAKTRTPGSYSRLGLGDRF